MINTQRKLKGMIFIDKENNVFAITPTEKNIEWFGIIKDQIDKTTIVCYNAHEDVYFRLALKKPPMAIIDLSHLITMYPGNNLPKGWVMQ